MGNQIIKNLKVMHEANLKIIKLLIVTLVFLTILVMIAGIGSFKNSYFFSWRFLGWGWQCIKTEIAWSRYNNFLFSPYQNNQNTAGQNAAKLIPILVYHGVINNPDWKPDKVNVSLKDFQNQMFALKRGGWQTISIEDYANYLSGKKQVSEKSFLLTFDDGRKDSFYGADPILKAVGYRATMFVITGRSLGADNEDSPFHLSESELKTMVANGRWDIGSHTQNGHESAPIDQNGTLGHYLSNKLWISSANRLETQDEYAARVANDLKNAKKDIEEKLGVKALSFAYPYGDLGQNSSNIQGGREILEGIANSIYEVSFVQAGNNDFVSNAPNNSRLSKRIGADSLISADELLATLDNSRAKNQNYSDKFTTNQGWLKGWGDLTIKNGFMRIGTNSNEDSASTFLSGTPLWKNYQMFANINLLRGNSFEMVARYRDENNYIICDFSKDQVILSQKIRGQDGASFAKNLPKEIKPGDIENASIKVSGNEASCYLDNILMISGNIDNSLNIGGVGFKTWDAEGQGRLFLVSDLKVNEI